MGMGVPVEKGGFLSVLFIRRPTHTTIPMSKRRIIGFIGRFPSSLRYKSYRSRIAGIIDQHLYRGGQIVLTGIGSCFEYECARHILQLRSSTKRVRLVLVITGRQKAAYDRACASGATPDKRQVLLELADEVVVVGRSDSFPSTAERLRVDYFVDRADKLYYFSGPEPSLPTQYLLYRIEGNPQTESENLYYPRPLTYETVDAESRDYLFRNQCTAYSHEVPDSLLRLWTLPLGFDWARYFDDAQRSAAELIDDVSDRPELLPLKVFFITYALMLLHRGCTRQWEQSREAFAAFQRLVRTIRQRRRAGSEIPRFDLFDYPRYPKILKQISCHV